MQVLHAFLNVVRYCVGTGKTTVMVEYIRQEAGMGYTVLVSADSNMACDNLGVRIPVEGRTAKGMVIRVGDKEQIHPSVRFRPAFSYREYWSPKITLCSLGIPVLQHSMLQ